MKVRISADTHARLARVVVALQERGLTPYGDQQATLRAVVDRGASVEMDRLEETLNGGRPLLPKTRSATLRPGRPAKVKK